MQNIMLLLLVAPLFAWASASGYDWNRNYGVDATVGRDDNFRLSESDQIATTYTSLGVFAELQGTTEVSSIGFAAGAGATAYSASSIDRSENYYLSLSTALRDERWAGTLDLSAYYEPTTETELQDTGNLVNGERRTVTVAPGISYQIDERSSVYSNLAYSNITYSTNSLTDYTDTSLSAGWIYQLSEISDISLNGSVSAYDPDDDGTSTVTGLQVGYGLNTSETTRYDLLLGYAENDSPTGTSSKSNSSFEVRHSFDERNDFSLFAGNGYVASGSGEVLYERRLNLRWDHALTERTQFILTSAVWRNEDRDYYEIVAGGSHQYTKEINLGANFRHRLQHSDENDADSNSVYVSLSYSPI